MASSRDPELVLVLEVDFRFGLSRRHLEDVLLPDHAPPLKLVEIPKAGPNNVSSFSVQEIDTSATWNLDTFLLSCIADEVAAANIAGLEDIKLPGRDGHMSATEWSLAVIGIQGRSEIRKVFIGNQRCPVGRDDGMAAE